MHFDCDHFAPFLALIVRRPFQTVSTLRFGEIIPLSCAPRTIIGKGTPRLRWYRQRSPIGRDTESDYFSATLEAIGSSDGGQYMVIEETDASGEVILRVKLTPASQGRYVCASFPDELADLAGEEELSKEKLLQKAVQHVPTDVEYSSGG